MRTLTGTHKTVLGRHYILTTPTKVMDISLDDLGDGSDDAWLEKSRRLQARRWHKIKNDLE